VFKEYYSALIQVKNESQNKDKGSLAARTKDKV
jgi:hypothetical protein